ncbi:MAG: PAS domain S-box protein [Spirochaetes bacterium]|jgi:PAS domain S-box-containing protein|nr:PAS domain S-box protein [Spirochaetota bacterium]
MAKKEKEKKEPAGIEALKKEISRLRSSERSLKKKVEDLEKFKRQFEYIVGITRTGVDIIDSDYNIVYIDPAWKKVYGDPAGKKCFEYFMDRSSICHGCGIPAAMQTGHSIVTEEILAKENNRVIEVHTIPYTDPDGTAYVAEFNIDITERKKLEEKAGEAKIIIENSPVILFKWRNEKDWPAVYVSENISHWGYTAKEFTEDGRFYSSIIHPDDLMRIIDEVNRHVIDARKEYGQEYRIITAGGEIRWVYDRTMVITGDGGKIEFFQGVLTDITERKSAEDALRKSEERWSTLVQNIYDIITVLDGEGKISYISPSVEKHLGFKQYDLLGKPGIELVHPDDLNTVIKDLQEVFNRTNPGIPTAFRYRNKDGSYIWFESIATNLLDNPAVQGLVIISRDITERKKSEDELRKNQYFSRKISDTVPMTIYIYDLLEDRNIYTNKNIYELIGYTPDEVKEMGHGMFGNLLHPDDMAKLPDNIHRFDNSNDTDVLELEYRMKDRSGGWRWVHSWDVIFTRTPEGRPAQILGAVQDVTLLKKAQQALLESEARYRSLSEASQDLIFVIGRDGTVLYLNTAGADLLGRDKKEIIGRKRSEFFPPEIAHRQEERLKFVFETGEFSRSEGMLYKDGQEFWFDHYLVPLKNEIGEIDSVLGIARDITIRKKSEEENLRMVSQLRQTQKLESLGVLAGGIAHDFNNLLTGILGNADLARTDIPAGSPAMMNIMEIQKISTRAAELCRQMLAYSGKGRFEVMALDLNELLMDMTHLIEISVSKKAALKFNFGEDLPSIEADQTQIRQVIMNLVINASESIVDSSGYITISTGAIECETSFISDAVFGDGRSGGRFVYLEVSDTGSGMSEDTKSRIFEPFFTTKFAGRGLGLAAVLGIVRGHNGMIKITTDPGRGTRFMVLFPAIDIKAESIRKSEIEVDGWRGIGTVLLVDDEESVLQVGKRMLEKIGFSVITACNGNDAMNILAGQTSGIRCIILDLTMPMMSGEETFEALRKINPDVKIIISSGYNEVEVSERFTGRSISGFIQKPYRLSDLVAKLRII